MSKDYTDKELKEMDLETACAEISNSVYEATLLFEKLEFTDRKIRGNGHHIRQKVAMFAKELMKERWNKSSC